MLYYIMFIIILMIYLFYSTIKINEHFSKWIKSSSYSVDKFKIKDGKIIKHYSSRSPIYDGLSNVKYIKKVYKEYLINWDFVPRMEFKKNNIIEDYLTTPLNKKNKPSDYKEQLINIDNTIKAVNMYHNDYRKSHFFVKNGKIYLIDWNNFLDYEPKWAKRRNNNNNIINKLK